MLTTYQDKIIQKVVKHFEGLHNIEILDILQKIETLLVGGNSPFQAANFKKRLTADTIKRSVFPISNKGYYQLEDHCHFISVYRLVTFTSIINFETLCFTKANDINTYELTNDNIIKAFTATTLEKEIKSFIQGNKVTKRNTNTKRLLLLEFLEQFDPKNI